MEHLVEDATSIVVSYDRKPVLSALKLMVKLLMKIFALLLCSNYVHQLSTSQATLFTHPHKLVQNNSLS